MPQRGIQKDIGKQLFEVLGKIERLEKKSDYKAMITISTIDSKNW